MKHIIYTRPDGGVSVLNPAPNAQLPGESEAAFFERIMAKDVPPGSTEAQVVEDVVIPSDRTFRNAWEIEGASVVVNMEKARELKRTELRRLRDPLLVQADVDYLKADETNDLAAKIAIVARKQKLRDVTNDPAIAAAQTPEALKAVMPAILLP